MSREYGWTDDVILDLTVRRFRQIVAAIERRKFFERRQQIALNSWMTRQITTFVAAGYMTDGKHGNPALDAAQILAFDEIEAAQIEESQQDTAGGMNSVPNPKNIPMFDENGDIIPLIPELKAGTHEAFMNSFGNPYSWGGR